MAAATGKCERGDALTSKTSEIKDCGIVETQQRRRLESHEDSRAGRPAAVNFLRHYRNYLKQAVGLVRASPLDKPTADVGFQLGAPQILPAQLAGLICLRSQSGHGDEL